jgi:hypothetical protein
VVESIASTNYSMLPKAREWPCTPFSYRFDVAVYPVQDGPLIYYKLMHVTHDLRVYMHASIRTRQTSQQLQSPLLREADLRIQPAHCSPMPG